MLRYSFSTSFVPRIGRDKEYMFYVTKNVWENGVCVRSEEIYRKALVMVPELDTCIDELSWAGEMADRAWHEIVAARSVAQNEEKADQSNTTPEH